ncbi:MAG: hypothetical protein KJ947_17685, partial [Alphaproteobacteria bacterium]|nr:hypothetical protein [Alphaproteobacteria bacterium]
TVSRKDKPSENPLDPSPDPNQHAPILLEFSRTKDIVASSAAALVGERFIVPTSKTSQHANFEAAKLFGKRLI